MTPELSNPPRRQALARLLALLVLVSFTSPWVVICLPDGAAPMPCCAKAQQTEQPPVVRGCCGPADHAPAETRGSITTTAVQMPAQHVLFVAAADNGARPRPPTNTPRAPHVDIRLLNAVFLI